MGPNRLDEHVDFIKTLNADGGKFKAFVRYMVQAAEQKRCVPYHELENVFGLSHKNVGWYAGILGDLCMAWKWPLLNSLIISFTKGMPSDGFKSYADVTNVHWGDHVQACWKKFHVTSTRAKQVKNFAGLDSHTKKFLIDPEKHLKGLPYFK
jgi:hypothetical protein